MLTPTMKGGASMDDRVRRIRAEISRLRHGRPPTAVRYPSALRQHVTAIARRRRAAGANVPAIAREMGVAPWTLALWLRTPSAAVIRAVAWFSRSIRECYSWPVGVVVGVRAASRAVRRLRFVSGA